MGDKEIIPAEYFFTQVVAPSFVSQQKLPPDDASHGYEHWNPEVDSTWDEATTFAALEASNYAGKRMDPWPEPMTRTKTETKDNHLCGRIFRYAFREKLTEEELEKYVAQVFRRHPSSHIR